MPVAGKQAYSPRSPFLTPVLVDLPPTKRCISMWRDSNPIKIGSVLVFVEKQEKADMLFKDLLKRSYPCLSLHGGKIVYNNTLHTFASSVGLNFRDLWMNRKVWPFTGNLLSSTFLGARWFQLSSLWPLKLKLLSTCFRATFYYFTEGSC